MKFERGLESGYVTTLAHVYEIIVGALNVTLHPCIERNSCVPLTSEPELNNKHTNVGAIF